ncbi:hypothetical protein PR003_g29470 [Phytophthora rubi]|uniref:Uncharacterized protein n=1 Tax=Phytophthora rubi TaxID=129364 RepID=A0A6A4BPR4_9STRA|nr:hypothetical protein PR003_g29470 [Phytophthora rubi]
MEQTECKRRIQAALLSKAFPPQIIFPEAQQQLDVLAPLAGLFGRPIVVWVPECREAGQKPQCISPGCLCTPRLKEYKHRVVQDVESKVELLYIKYQCTGADRRCFSTVSQAYLQRSVETLLHFPYLTSHKTGYAKNLMEMVHDGITSPSGLAKMMDNIRRRRQVRYYKLYTLFSDRLQRLRRSNPAYLTISPPSCDLYCQNNAVPTEQVMTAVWLETTEVWSSLAEKLMRKMQVKRAIRMDHSVKFCKKLKVWTGSGKRESMSDAKMLLLVQNEIGQIVGRRLTRSENNEETEALLRWVKPSLCMDNDEVNCICLVSDNATGVKGMVGDVFEKRVTVKQDPFHVIQRISEKVKSPRKKQVCKELKEALYTVDGKLRPPTEMALRFRQVTTSLSASDICCSEAKWRGCCDSNISQIESGDLYVDDNTYSEGGHQIRVVSTSQLEGFHAGLKKLIARSVSVKLGLRILDIFIVQHNLRVGADFGRNPDFGALDFVSLAQAALLSRGSLPESPQLAFALHILSEPLDQPQYRSASSTDFSFAQWQRMFDSVHVDSSNVDATLSAPQNHFQSVKELLMKSATSVVTNRLPKHAFLASLSLDANSYEPAAGFTSQEYELLRQIRAEQEREECQWSKCLLITTIMYNLVVANNPNTALALQRRSYATIVSKLASLSARKSEAKPSSSRRVNLFALHQNRPVTSATTAYERSFLEQLFDALRGSRLFKGKKKLFCKVYDFASRVCDGIFPKEEAILTRKWGSLKRSSNRFTSLKIKLKLPPQQSTSPTATVVTDSASAPTAAIAVGVSSCTSDARSLPNQKQISSACDRGQSLLRDSAKEFGHGGTPIEESASQLLKSQLLAAGFDPASGEGTAQQFLVASTPSAEPLTPADSSHRQHSPEIMTDEDVSFFLSMAESTPRDPQKWKLIHAKYIERFPSSLRNPNALRCKLAKEKRRRVPEVVTLAPLPSKKSRTSSCESCRRKKKRCGVGSINPSCARAPLQSSRALDDYFSGA